MPAASVVAGSGLVLAAASPGRPADHRFDAGYRGEDEGGQEAADLVGRQSDQAGLVVWRSPFSPGSVWARVAAR